MKEFNYLYEKRRMLDSLGRTGGECDGVSCLECPLNAEKHDKCIRCIGAGYVELDHIEEATHIVRKWAEEHPEPEVDWTKVPVDTKIMVKRTRNSEWEKRHFAEFVDGNIFAYDDGRTSFTTNQVSLWRYVELAEE